MIESIRSTQRCFLFLRMIVVKCVPVVFRRKKKEEKEFPYGSDNIIIENTQGKKKVRK